MKIRRLIICGILIAGICTAAAAEGFRETAMAVLRSETPYRHTVPMEAALMLEEGKTPTAESLDVIHQSKKGGRTKWAVAVHLFQAQHCPENPSFMETVDGRHLLDAFLAQAHLIPHVYHILPEEGEISQDAAWQLAEETLRSRFGLYFAGMLRNIFVQPHYFSPTGERQDAFWLFHVTMESGETYSIRVKEGKAIQCLKAEQPEALFYAYTKLCDEKGAFFTWTPEEKAAYAARLPEAILSAYLEGQDLSRCKDLLAIAGQGFCLPGKDVMSRTEAQEKALFAVEEAFALKAGWAARAETYYSFFRQEDRLVWRVIFWKTGEKELPGAVVDMDAETGDVFRVEHYDATPDSIPYAERL